VILALGSAERAAAQPTVEDTAIARSLFEQGVGCADQNDWACAANRFGQAHTLRPSPVIALNWGQALARLGRFVEAAELIGRVARNGDASAELRTRARSLLAEIEPQLGSIRVVLDGASREVSLELDGRAFATALVATDVPVDPGEHVIRALAEGNAVAEARGTVAPGASLELRLEIPDAVAEPTPIEETEPEPESIASPVSIVAVDPEEEEESSSGVWVGIAIGGGVLAAAAAAVLVVVFVTSQGQDMFEGTLGVVELR
jgi:hypothetical protein